MDVVYSIKKYRLKLINNKIVPFYQKDIQILDSKLYRNSFRTGPGLLSITVSIIHGSPRTEALKHDGKILCCAPSNIAVDNLIERLGRKKEFKLIRLGHPARLLESIQCFSLESIVMENYQDVKNTLRKDLNQCFIIVIDECSQVLEVACWLDLLRVTKCVLAGDH
ncbi:unnamed protein product [Rotaria sordida]|uniref:DNA2/NAM7 helicase helicase domain-containing protein n=1 Tax=Rotaria sordida TaxID=392033 RepID=A0A819VGF3_9BILA|nr:unnamed protein product [Rotaria sordida]CAF1650803.1 unnamed protein product [Rotaria sordida]CAF4108885.1 unnamed protein product [Rotaria sordida]